MGGFFLEKSCPIATINKATQILDNLKAKALSHNLENCHLECRQQKLKPKAIINFKNNRAIERQKFKSSHKTLG